MSMPRRARLRSISRAQACGLREGRPSLLLRKKSCTAPSHVPTPCLSRQCPCITQERAPRSTPSFELTSIRLLDPYACYSLDGSFLSTCCFSSFSSVLSRLRQSRWDHHTALRAIRHCESVLSKFTVCDYMSITGGLHIGVDPFDCFSTAYHDGNSVTIIFLPRLPF